MRNAPEEYRQIEGRRCSASYQPALIFGHAAGLFVNGTCDPCERRAIFLRESRIDW
jgi:hypothetical protein